MDRTTPPSQDRTRLVLDYVHSLLAAPAAPADPARLLDGLARAFGVAGAGIGGPADGEPQVQHRLRLVPASAGQRTPWDAQGQLLAELEAMGWAEGASGGESYLAAAMPGKCHRLLWLEEPGGRSWSAGERGALSLAAGVMDRLIPDAAPGPALGQIDQVRYQQRLHDAATLSGKLAHAFDNVLTGILGFAELTLAQCAPGSVVTQYISEVLQAAQQGAQLTQQFHQFSRSSNVAGGAASVPLVLAEQEQRLRSGSESKLQLQSTVPADLPLAAIGAENLNQVLHHIIDNAREAAGAAGTITLSAGRADLDRAACASLLGNASPGSYIAIVVTDSGPGLNAEARQRLFVEPFFSTKPRHRGLGLALVYRTLHAHKAGFRLQPGPAGGTEVRVYLPVAPAHGPRAN